MTNESPDFDGFLEEADAWLAEEEAIANEAGTCCSDPTPAVDDGLVGEAEDTPPGYPGAPLCVYYCQSCDKDMTRERYEALMADLPSVMARIAGIRAERRGV